MLAPRSETKTPNGFFAYVRKDAHKLIEEFMLLANCAVAEKIESSFPDLAFLRCHPPPSDENCTKLKESMEPHGIHVNTDSSKAFAASIKNVLQKVRGFYEHFRLSDFLLFFQF